MPLPPVLARTIAQSRLSPDEMTRLGGVHFHDAGHGYDAFGLHPAFVAMAEALTLPIYEKYFRVKSYNAHHVPEYGPAILAANHSGNIPIDGSMIWTDVLRHTNPPRVLRAVADHFVPALPWIGTLFARSGVVGGSRGNARALLEAGELLLIFPEGTPGILKPWSQRYQLQDFRVGFAELAIRHSAPVVPVGVVGAEEQLPALFASKRLGALVGAPAVAIPIVPLPLPVRYHLHYGEPLRFDQEYAPAQADDPLIVREAAERVKAAVAALIKTGLATREGVFK